MHTQQVLGDGKVGTIFCATWHTLQNGERKIAFKLHKDQTRSKEWLASFILEIKDLCKLQHPNIVKIYGAVEEFEKIGTAMELLQCSLHQAIIKQNTPLSERKRFTFIRQISDGLKFLHASKIVHSNLTSKNIFLSFRNIAKIGNYGPKLVRSKLASSYDPVWEDLDKDYAAPELLHTSPLQIDQVKKADMYSLALVAYEVLSSKEPCDEHPSTVLRVPRSGLAAFLRSRNMSIEMFEIIRPCLITDEPHNRPSADEFTTSWRRVTTNSRNIITSS